MPLRAQPALSAYSLTVIPVSVWTLSTLPVELVCGLAGAAPARLVLLLIDLKPTPCNRFSVWMTAGRDAKA